MLSATSVSLSAVRPGRQKPRSTPWQWLSCAERLDDLDSLARGETLRTPHNHLIAWRDAVGDADPQTDNRADLDGYLLRNRVLVHFVDIRLTATLDKCVPRYGNR